MKNNLIKRNFIICLKLNDMFKLNSLKTKFFFKFIIYNNYNMTILYYYKNLNKLYFSHLNKYYQN